MSDGKEDPNEIQRRILADFGESFARVFQNEEIQADCDTVLTCLADLCFMHQTTMVDDDPNGRWQAKNEGKRELYLALLWILEMNERNVREIRSKTIIKSTRAAGL